jgi:hypothetical protein
MRGSQGPYKDCRANDDDNDDDYDYDDDIELSLSFKGLMTMKMWTMEINIITMTILYLVHDFMNIFFPSKSQKNLCNQIICFSTWANQSGVTTCP